MKIPNPNLNTLYVRTILKIGEIGPYLLMIDLVQWLTQKMAVASCWTVFYQKVIAWIYEIL